VAGSVTMALGPTPQAVARRATPKSTLAITNRLTTPAPKPNPSLVPGFKLFKIRFSPFVTLIRFLKDRDCLVSRFQVPRWITLTLPDC
jgi:hypothetical protein